MVAPSVGLVAGFVFLLPLSGVASPFAMLVGTLICLTLAIVVGDFARKIPSAGSAYAYLTHAFGPKTGFVAGAALFLAYLILLPFQAGYFGSYFSSYLATLGIHIPWVVWAIALFALSSSLAILGVAPSLKVGLIALGAEMTIFIALGATILIKGGESGLSVAPFNPANAPGGVHGSLLAIVFGIFTYGGFETSATLGEEAVEPTRTIPRAMFTSILALGAFFVFMVYAAVVGFGANDHGLAAMQNTQVPFNDLAERYVGHWFSVLVTFDVVFAFAALNIVTVSAIARMFFSMGRDGLLPRAFGRTNARSAPYVAAAAVGASGLAATILCGLAWGPSNVAAWAGFIATLFFIASYALLSVGLPVYYWRRYRREFRWWRHAVIPFVALLGLALVTWGNTYPIPDPPFQYFIYVVLVVLAALTAFAIWFEHNRPELFAEAGKLLGE